MFGAKTKMLEKDNKKLREYISRLEKENDIIEMVGDFTIIKIGLSNIDITENIIRYGKRILINNRVEGPYELDITGHVNNDIIDMYGETEKLSNLLGVKINVINEINNDSDVICQMYGKNKKIIIGLLVDNMD